MFLPYTNSNYSNKNEQLIDVSSSDYCHQWRTILYWTFRTVIVIIHHSMGGDYSLLVCSNWIMPVSKRSTLICHIYYGKKQECHTRSANNLMFHF